jgi:hypothetical protein
MAIGIMSTPTMLEIPRVLAQARLGSFAVAAHPLRGGRGVRFAVSSIPGCGIRGLDFVWFFRSGAEKGGHSDHDVRPRNRPELWKINYGMGDEYFGRPLRGDRLGFLFLRRVASTFVSDTAVPVDSH